MRFLSEHILIKVIIVLLIITFVPLPYYDPHGGVDWNPAGIIISSGYNFIQHYFQYVTSPDEWDQYFSPQSFDLNMKPIPDVDPITMFLIRFYFSLIFNFTVIYVLTSLIFLVLQRLLSN
ncbi:MAG: hypothetical protein A2844_02350 [Candidatus Ryanbacteria bacterium RIFCSPHIGHO2_01_FULL_48_80]|nr:MAG: hypothetical protein A2844_02350 [Candidatus Ryanbacteria bacterium RIFCSPHIGHO2_01_FULL_48_80]